MPSSSSPSAPPAPEKVAALQGRVRTEPRGGGSKSAHEAVLLDTARGCFVLRFKQGPAMGDERLLALRGQTIACDGFVIGATLLAESITVLP